MSTTTEYVLQRASDSYVQSMGATVRYTRDVNRAARYSCSTQARRFASLWRIGRDAAPVAVLVETRVRVAEEQDQYAGWRVS